jgi:MFS family permease
MSKLPSARANLCGKSSSASDAIVVRLRVLSSSCSCNRLVSSSDAEQPYANFTQFCGVNVIAYYSTDIFRSGGFSYENALLVSLGTGIVNWLFAIPAIYTIDTFGRRNLLLTGFPLMAICLFWGGFSFLIGGGPPTEGDPANPAQLGSIAAAIFCFMAIYSPSEGPVPFTYSAEAFPLYIRDIGMSFATAVRDQMVEPTTMYETLS